MSSVGLESLARTAYEAHRTANPRPMPSWEDVDSDEQAAWRAAVSAVAAQTGTTLVESSPSRSLTLESGGQRYTFSREFTAGRQGDITINDDFASSHHARFKVFHGLWFVEDLGSTNGTWLNGRRFHAAQRLKKGDKVKIGHSVIQVIAS